MVPGQKQASVYCLSGRLLGLVPVRHHKGPYLTLEEVMRFVRNFLCTSGSGGLAAAPTSKHGPLAHDGRLDVDNDWNSACCASRKAYSERKGITAALSPQET